MSEEIKKEQENKNMEEVMEFISLAEVVDVCQKYTDGEITQEELDNWGKDIKFIRYLPLTDKILVITDILFCTGFDDNMSLEWQVAQLEEYKLWKILLNYTNIATEGYEEYQNMYNYDLIYSVLGDWMLMQCYTDYDRTVKMLESTMNVYNIQKMMESFASFDPEKLEKSDQMLKEQLELLDKNKVNIDKMAQILLNK